MITDERLKEMWDELEEAILYGDPTVFNRDEFIEQQQIIDEILSLRKQKQRLIEDGERMAKAINRSLDHFMGIDKSDYIEVVNELSESYEFHNALLKELEEKK